MVCSTVPVADHRYSTSHLSFLELPANLGLEKLAYALNRVDKNLEWAMSQPLPVSDFEWNFPEEVSKHEICQHPDDAPKGYIFEVDFEYPPELLDF
ncbi:hypothetical protein AVEN_177-1 [Araneus ventricosus]|uniref:Uncharacterized protein n=1 Tax=Araneus ventricosus TaxID=182803 RepID=A0A4Y2D494_ARAVE|nr:hypothetical protein AVEN_177-1 [Araneus ventricosus]